MQTLIEKLRAAVAALLSRRAPPWLLLSCTDADAPIVLKVLQDCERTSRRDVFLLFATPFHDPAGYAADLWGLLRREHQALASALAARGEAPPPPLPASLGSDQATPAQQLTALLAAAARLLPDDRRLLCALWPLGVRDPAAYAQLLAMLLGTAEGAAASAPWPPQVRLIARELGTGAASASALRCDFSPAAVTCSLRETTIDPRQPEAVRMHALLVLAQQEQAQGRAAAAIALYTQVLAYHREKRNLAMQAVVLLQLGETHHRQMQLAQARQCYEQALTPAAAQASPCVAQLAKNLGDLAMLEQHPDEAVRCYRTWARIAEHLGDQHGAAAARTQLRQAASLRRNLPEQSQEAQ